MPQELWRRCSKWTRCGRSRSRTIGSWGGPLAWQSMARITSGSCIGRTRSPQANSSVPRTKRRAALRPRQFSNSIRLATLSGTGAVRVPAMTGQSRCTGSRPTARGTSGSVPVGPTTARCSSSPETANSSSSSGLPMRTRAAMIRGRSIRSPRSRSMRRRMKPTWPTVMGIVASR